MSTILSEGQRRDFRERGYFVLGRVFDDTELAELRAAYDTVLGHPLKLGERGKGPFDRFFLHEPPAETGVAKGAP